MSKYIIIDAEAIQKRIEELKERIKSDSNEDKMITHHRVLELKQILSQSTPLIPEIEKAFEAGENNIDNDGCHIDKEGKQDYISNLKLDI